MTPGPPPGRDPLRRPGDRRVAPDLLRRGRRLVASIFRPGVEREVADELDFHLAMRVREYVAGGMDEEEARRRALAGFGDIDEVRARCARLAEGREGRMRRTAWIDGVRQDLGFALRQIVRGPGFAAVTVLTLALAIGANTAVFSVVHGVLLKPLPWEEPDELVALWTRYLPSTGVDIPQFPISAPEVLDYRDASTAMEAVAPYYVGSSNLGSDGGEPVSIEVLHAGRDLLPLLGLRLALGRSFSRDETAPGAPPTVLLGHDLWIERFGGDPDVLGRSVSLDGESALVVGVLPEGAGFPDEGVDLWVPLRLDEADPGSRGAHWLRAVGRLADGVGLAAAEAELGTVTAAWNERWEHHASGHFLFLRPLRDDLVGEARPILWALFGAVGLVLLVACGNVANLFLVRGESRAREMAVRTALGAGRGRLVRQLLTEAFVLALVGGAAGVVLAARATPLLLGLDPTAIPRSGEVSVSLPVLAFTGALVLVATLLFGAVPGIRAGRGSGPAGDLGGGRDAVGRPAARSRRVLVAAEVALSLVVLLAAGLVARSFWSLRGVDAGVDEAGVASFELELPSGRYGDPGEVQAFWDELDGRLEALPGVRAVGATSALPGTGEVMRSDFLPEGEPAAGDGVPAWNAQLRAVRPGFFEAAGISLVAGRLPGPGDDADGPLVAVVDEAAVDRFWPGEDVLGRRITFSVGDPGDGERPWLTIVGVAGNVLDELDGPAEPHVWVPRAQLAAASLGAGRSMTVVWRSDGDPAALFGAVRRTVRELDPTLPVSRLRTLEATLDAAVARERLAADLFLAFGAAALLLATLGVYGVVSWSAARRTREVGVRMALGAGRGRVVRMMVAEGAAPALAGAAIGLAVALAGAPLVGDLLFGVGPRDLPTFVAAPLGLLAVAALASWVPARRATRIAPSEALRAE